jgi:outer membrane lipoprotein LolB
MPVRRILVFMVLLVQACATIEPPGEKALLFAVQGRISVQYGEQSMSGLLNWQAEPASDEILLSSPLGQGLASITRDASGLSLTRPGQPTATAESAEDLTESTLGFRLPLSGLRYWIQGKAYPERASSVRLGEAGEFQQIIQDDWTIDYLEYRESLPRKINVKREGMQIRLVIDEWQP